MNIEDLKGLMDEFDPASLLPELDSVMGTVARVARIAVLAGPVVLLVMGLLYLFFAPREANYYFGYRCYFGMGSEEAWRFSQRIAGMVWSLLGLILTVVMLLCTNGFPGMEIPQLIHSAVRCVIWEAALTAVSCLLINCAVMYFFDRNGERRPRKAPPVKLR